MTTSEYTRDEIETGRKLFSGDWQFVAASSSPESLPKMRATEIAFAGRSNVGKSSLINAVTGRKALARISRTPGRTQELIFFSAGGPLTLVDMPGYGYAAAAKSRIANWTDLIEQYLHGRANLARVYVLVDARHGPKANDLTVMNELDKTAVSYQVVLTKADKPAAGELDKVTEATRAAIARRPAAHPELIVTSSETRSGLDILRAEIAALAAQP
jgi:GTP-binding protein